MTKADVIEILDDFTASATDEGFVTCYWFKGADSYQEALDKEWLEELQGKHNVKVNKEVLYSIGEQKKFISYNKGCSNGQPFSVFNFLHEL